MEKVRGGPQLVSQALSHHQSTLQNRQQSESEGATANNLQGAKQGGFAGAGGAHDHGPKAHSQRLMQLKSLVHKACRRLQALLLKGLADGCLQLAMRLKPKQLLQSTPHDVE